MTTQKESTVETSNGEKRIKITKNGAYFVSGGIPLIERTIICNAEGIAVEWHTGNTIATEEEYELCRCGRTFNKTIL